MMGTQQKHPEPADQGMPDLRALPATDTLAAREVVDWFRSALLEGREWYPTLLGAIGRWPLAQEEVDGVRYQYLLLGEAFDWLMLAGRLVTEVDGLIPTDEKEALLFQSRLPQDIPESQFRSLIGPDKYRAHLNYFYGVVVEESLLLAVEEEIRKEHVSRGLPDGEYIAEAAYYRVYGDSQEDLIEAFCQDMGRAISSSICLTELKEFTYWLFKRRVDTADSARVASDTKKGLERLFRLSSPYRI